MPGKKKKLRLKAPQVPVKVNNKDLQAIQARREALMDAMRRAFLQGQQDELMGATENVRPGY